MDEIRKVRVMARPMRRRRTNRGWSSMPTRENAVRQVKAFDAALGLTGLVMTKLDGTAKGGAVAAIAREHPVAIRLRRHRREAATCARSWPPISSTRCSRDPFLRVAKRYPGGHEALRGVTAEIAEGEMVAITGAGRGQVHAAQARRGIERASSAASS